MSERHGPRPARSAGLPATAVTTKIRSAEWVLDRRQGGAPVRELGEPSHTMSCSGLARGRDVWVLRQNARTVAPVRALSEPAPTITAGHDSGERVWEPEKRRVSVAEAAALQTFPVDYPWQGSRSKQFEQIGNAVPPLFAEAVLRAVAR